MLLRLIRLSFFLFFVFPIFADSVDVYQVSVPVQNQSEAQRAQAFSQALHVLSDRLNKNSPFHQEVDLSTPLQHPEQYVASFSYFSDPEQPEILEIQVNFDRQALAPFIPQVEKTQTHSLKVQVHGVHSTDVLHVVYDYLRHVHGVESVMVQHVSNDHVVFVITVQGKDVTLLQALLSDQHLVAMNANDDSDQAELNFQWMD